MEVESFSGTKNNRFVFSEPETSDITQVFFTATTALREERTGVIIDDGKQKYISAITDH